VKYYNFENLEFQKQSLTTQPQMTFDDAIPILEDNFVIKEFISRKDM